FILVCVIKTCKIIPHLSLRRYSHFQFIISLLVCNDKLPSHPVSIPTKGVVKNFIIDKWFAITIIVKPDTFFAKFLYVDGNGRNEISHNTFNSIHGNAPDAEETKNMIDTESVEVIAHLFKSLTPPRKTILLHSFPVVSRETPVLPFYRKIIRRRTGLHTHVV